MSFNPATPASIATNPHAPLAPARAEAPDGDNARAASLELAAWLCALPSFLALQNHPLGDAELSSLAGRNYIHEARILKQALRRCLHLSFLICAEPRDGDNADDGTTQARLSSSRGFALAPDAIRAVRESLCEIYGACCAFAAAKRLDQVGWSGLRGSTLRTLTHDGSHARAVSEPPDDALRRLLPEVHALLEAAAYAHDAENARELSLSVSHFARALDQLALVGAWLRDDRPLKMTLPVFTHVHEGARAAVSALERIARREAEGKGGWYELCDGAAYAVRMELNKVFRRELTGLAASRHPSTVFTKVENSYGLLRDCFQQTIISLARALDADFDGEQLFDSLRAKLTQSLELRRELWALAESVRRAERDGDRKPLAPLVARLREFESGAMRHLMYKDWESFERFVAEVTAARGAVELVPVLHRFATYLDALFNQINMRAVLADRPFDFTLVPD